MSVSTTNNPKKNNPLLLCPLGKKTSQGITFSYVTMSMTSKQRNENSFVMLQKFSLKNLITS